MAKTEYKFTGKVIRDLQKLGLEEKTTITYPIDYLQCFLGDYILDSSLKSGRIGIWLRSIYGWRLGIFWLQPQALWKLGYHLLTGLRKVKLCQ